MKYLSHYKEQATNVLLDENGGFFAFSKDQFNEKKQQNVNYVSCGHGLIVPKPNVDIVIDGLSNIHMQGIAQDLAENGKDAIIQRELGNYECQITGDISDAVDALEGYGITLDEIKAGYKVFFKHCCDNDLF